MQLLFQQPRLIGDQVIGLFAPRFARANLAGSAYVGAVGSSRAVNEIAVLGNSANLAARLSSNAAEGEVLISEEAATSAGLMDRKLEKRRLQLKGITNPVAAWVMTVTSES